MSRFVFNRSTTGAQNDSTRGTFSPLAYFSTVTLSEHDAVQKQLDIVRQSAQSKTIELDEVTRAHRRQAELALLDIDRKEQVLRGDFVSIENVIATLRTSVDREFQLDAADTADYEEEKAALRAELESLAILEDDLKRLRDSVATESSHTNLKKSTFVRETERGINDIAKTREETVKLGFEISRHATPPDVSLRAKSPIAVRHPVTSFVSPRPPATPPQTAMEAPVVLASRYLSPTRRGAAGAVSPTRVREATLTPTRSRVVSPPRAPTQEPPMHQLCRDGQVSDALALLRQRPEIINELDADANTPLHAACASPRVSLELINALLVAGSSTAAKNDDGYTPFHIACLNPADHAGHSLKKLLLFKAGVNPNQRTSRGETAAHLCAKHDKHLESLKYLTGAGSDLTIAALTAIDEPSTDLKDSIGSPKRLTPLEVAQRAGVRSRRSVEVLKSAS